MTVDEDTRARIVSTASASETPAKSGRHRLVLIHPIDPRGQKVGGIETHVRLMLQHAPADWSVLLVGVDGRGDCPLGRITPMDFLGRPIDFLPVIFYPEEQAQKAAKSLGRSITMLFMLGLVRHLLALRRAIGAAPASVELQRFEFALIPFLLGRPTVQIIHGEGSRGDKMDSLLKKYWFLHRINEQIAVRLAAHIVCVNPSILTRLERISPKLAAKATFMPVAVDTKVFGVQALDTADGVLRIVFAGRLDDFKDPPAMFRVLARVHQILQGACEFHYVGTTDPERFAEFDAIRRFTVLHGFQPSARVAAIMARCHMGILTSLFEGMPCYLLELLSVGRPMVAARLPQFDALVEAGVSGALIERTGDDAAFAEAMAARIVAVWSDLKSGRMTPRGIQAKAAPFSVDSQLGRHFARHERLGRAGRGPPQPG